jgi:hypothetical protein
MSLVSDRPAIGRSVTQIRGDVGASLAGGHCQRVVLFVRLSSVPSV